MAGPVAGFIPPPVRVPVLPPANRPNPAVPNPTGQEWPVNPWAPVNPWWNRPGGRPPGDWSTANSRPRQSKVQQFDQYAYEKWNGPVDVLFRRVHNNTATAIIRCSTGAVRVPASSSSSNTDTLYENITSLEYIGGFTSTTQTCAVDSESDKRPYAFTEITRWTDAAGKVYERRAEYNNVVREDFSEYFKATNRYSGRIVTVNGQNYSPQPLPLPPDWVQPDATPDEPATEPEELPGEPTRPPLAPPLIPPLPSPEETPAIPGQEPAPVQPPEPGVTPAPSPTPIPPPVGIPGRPGTGTGTGTDTGTTPGTGGGGGGGGGGGTGLPGTDTGTDTGTTPEWQEDFLGKPIGQPSERPPATAQGTASMLGKLEQKLRVVGELVQKIPTTPGGGGGGTDWGDLLQLLTQLLTAPYPAGSYQLGDPCNPNQQPVEVPWPAGVGEFAELRARVDALAALVAEHKKMGQPVCVKERQGKPVTVILREKR